MHGLISFHPVDPSFFEGTVEPLVAGEKIDPDPFVTAARHVLVSSWAAGRYKRTLEFLAEQIEPPPPPEDGTLWEKIRARLERFDHQPEPIVRLVHEKIDPDLHLHGRPFLITEGAADSVSVTADRYLEIEVESNAQSLVREQLVRLDAKLAEEVAPDEDAGAPSPMGYRADLLAELKVLFDLARAAREDKTWSAADSEREPARTVLARELAWRAVWLHSRAQPFWIGRDVDGLETLCRAAGIEAPGFLVSARPLFARSSVEFPGLCEQFQVEIDGERSIGAYVAPRDVGDLLAFLAESGSGIIRAATRHGVGPTCTTLLRKIRECAHYAEQRGFGYLEASGIRPVG